MRQTWRVDGAVALAVSGVAVVEVLSAHRVVDVLLADPTAARGVLGTDLVLALLTTLPLAVRRRWPTVVPFATFGVQVVVNVTVLHHFPFFAGMCALALMAYTCGRYAVPRAARLGWLGPVAWAASFPVRTVAAQDPASVLYALVLLTLPWVAGRVIRRLHDQRAELDSALASVSALEAERRDAALLTERARIAREMHDVVAHGVSVMVVQAGAARLGVPESEPSHGQLLAVEQTGRRVLGELRRTVALLRSGADGGAGHGVTPVPGLRDLPELVGSMRDAGLAVELSTPEAVRPDPPRELVVYRVVQEALTNCLRHAGSTTVRVVVTGGATVRVTVTDLGGRPAAADDGGGFGLRGMGERVSLYGGRMRAGPVAGGFEVDVEIPWEEP